MRSPLQRVFILIFIYLWLDIILVLSGSRCQHLLAGCVLRAASIRACLADYDVVASHSPYCQGNMRTSTQETALVQEATVAFHKLSPAQFNTGWVLCQLGRAYYEMVDYPAAANVFEFARQADRHRLEVWQHPLWT